MTARVGTGAHAVVVTAVDVTRLLQKRLGPFYKNMPLREFKFLMGGETEITMDSLKHLLADNEIKGFDPVAEAFKVYDPEGTGFASTESMRQIFARLGFEDLSEQDMLILVRLRSAPCGSVILAAVKVLAEACVHCVVVPTIQPSVASCCRLRRQTWIVTAGSVWRIFEECWRWGA